MSEIKGAHAELQGVKSHLHNILYLRLRCMNMIQNSK